MTRRSLGTVGISCVLAAAAVAAAAGETGLVKDQPHDLPSVATSHGYMVPYSEQIPGTDVSFTMVPIAGGEFLLGSPESEADRNADEGPQVRVRVQPFWMGQCEVTWAEYHTYMAMYQVFKSLDQLRGDAEQVATLPAVKEFFAHESLEVDSVTSPTPLYDPDTTYMAGEDPDQPAVTMTQFAAKQYTKWLSGLAGRHYRLPTEAEWEYAARAGSTTAYSFGDEPTALGEHAWYADNSDDLTHAVGTKQPNAWGLHDMHGNVAEWVLDAYVENHYGSVTAGMALATDAIAWPTRLFPRSIRGGGWFDDAELCRSAARYQSNDPEWNVSDPNLPKSPWWFTEEPAAAVGFRIIRPLEPMDDATRKKVWEADTEYLQLDVAERLEEGRGAQSAADTRLPAVIEALQSAGTVE